MCLHIKYGTKLQTAKEDMTVYKVLNSNDRSIIRDFKYEANKLYRLRKPLKPKDDDTVHQGFHAFVDLVTLRAHGYGHALYGRTINKKIIEVTIPKGAKYYIGTHGDIVATSMRAGNLARIVRTDPNVTTVRYGNYPYR